MKELSEINTELEKEIIEIVEEGNVFHESNLYTVALDHYQEGWEKLPDDKQWSFLTYWIAGCLYQVYFDTQEYNKAKDWIKISMAGQTSKIDTGGFMDLGMVCYELKQYDEAYAAFDSSFKIGNKRAFKERPKKYLDFYLERKDTNTN